MHRNYLLHLLDNYRAWDSYEKQSQETIYSFVKANTQCFERSLVCGHVTASAWLINRDNSAALLMYHTKLKAWLQLGGHCDGESDVLAVAVKEAQEESGIQMIEPKYPYIFDVDVHLIPENHKEKAHYHYDIRFLLQIVSNEQPVKNNESKALVWVHKEKDTLPTLNPSIVRMHEKWCALDIS
jgi:8-oxo-dGTP pyrophosphatase MutT (NUDIX family)